MRGNPPLPKIHYEAGCVISLIGADGAAVRLDGVWRSIIVSAAVRSAVPVARRGIHLHDKTVADLDQSVTDEAELGLAARAFL